MAARRSGIFDQFVAVGAEAVYGASPADFKRVVPSRSDAWPPEVQEINTDGLRPNRQTMQNDQTTHVPVGGTGTVETPIAEDGSLLILRDLLDTVPAMLVDVADSDGKTMTIETDVVGQPLNAVRSLSYVVGRVGIDQARRETIYKGCTLVDWSLACSVGDVLMATLNYDWVSSVDRVDSLDATYTTLTLDDLIKGPWFTWEKLALTIGGVSLPCFGMELSGNRGLAVDRRYLQGSTTKARPLRGTIPVYTGSFECHLNAATKAIFEKWPDDAQTGPIVLTFTGKTNIATDPAMDTVRPSIVITINDAKVTGQQATAQLDGLTTQTLDVRAIDDGSASKVVTVAISSASLAID